MLKYYYANIELLAETEQFEYWLEKVNTLRREKVFRCKNEKDKKRVLLAGVLLRYGLEKEGVSYETIVFSKTPEGKPIIKSEIPIHFSISHAGDYVGCLISDEPVGVDIECLEKPVFCPEKEKHLVAMAKKCLSVAEWAQFRDSTEKTKLFMEYWTKKEAYSKCIGVGLGMDFSSINTESEKDGFWSNWTSDGYCVSIYRKKESYKELVIEKLSSL